MKLPKLKVPKELVLTLTHEEATFLFKLLLPGWFVKNAKEKRFRRYLRLRTIILHKMRQLPHPTLYQEEIAEYSDALRKYASPFRISYQTPQAAKKKKEPAF